MSQGTVVDKKFSEFRSISEHIAASNNISLINDTNAILQKSFLLCVASYFEKRLYV
jgi:hypothetical protein